MIKKTLKFASLWIFIAFINVFLASICSLSPIYFAFLISLLLLFTYFSIIPNFKITICDKDDNIIILLVLALCINIMLSSFMNKSSIRSFVSIIFTDFCFIFSFYISLFPKEKIRKTIYIFKYITILLFIIEAIYRFYYSESKHSYFYFYDYKHNCIMFPDTNALGVCIEFFLCFLFYLDLRKIIKTSIIEYVIIFSLLILTFSRGAIVGVLCVLLFLYFRKCRFILIKGMLIICVLYFAVFIIAFFLSDESFRIRIELYLKTLEYIKTIDFWHLLIGKGIDSSIAVFSRYGHAFVILYVVELGMINLLLLLIFFVLLLAKTRFSCIIIIPFITTGFMYMPYIIPFFFLYLGLIYNIECHRNDLFNYIIKERKKHGKELCLCFTYRR